MRNKIQSTAVTIQDVAAAAGVSTASVSRALSGSRPVRPETLHKVLEATRRLNYQVNPVASALRGKITKTVGMVVPDITNPFFPAVVKSVEDVLHDLGMSLFLCDSSESPVVEAERIAALLNRGVDGIIVSPVDNLASRAAIAAAAKRVPLVQIDRHVNVDSDIVTVDHGAGIALAIDHLISIGADSFAFVTTAKQSSIANERLAAYMRKLRPLDRMSAHRVLRGDLTVEWGRTAALKLIDESCPRAIVCANDLIALGVLQALRSQGLKVPQDVAVTGFDDGLLAQVANPPLTSVHQPLEALGREAVRMLTSAIEDRSLPPRKLRLAPSLSIRESTVPTASETAGPSSN